MDEALAANPNVTRKFDPMRDGPALGSWWWVRDEDNENRLMCVTHKASNHIVFEAHDLNVSMRYHEVPDRCRPEANWQKLIQGWIAEKQSELATTVQKLQTTLAEANLLEKQGSSDDTANSPQSLLPALTRTDPEERKQKLFGIKLKDYPAFNQKVKDIVEDIVLLQKDLLLPMTVQANRARKAVGEIDKQLFALELYAGLFQKCRLIADGAPAPVDTPISVRQMLRYMDEECLIDFDRGGMDYKRIGDFDRWVVKPENLNRLAPEPRCIVALKVRRLMKNYPNPLNFLGFFQQMEEHKANAFTYLLLRNGQKVYRLACDIEFDPRLLPYREEFNRPFTRIDRRYVYGRVRSDEPDYKDEEIRITPDHLEYDDHVEKRREALYRYNRVMFLVQGLLDRSEVFAPHLGISLANPEHVERYFRAIFDEEDGLPSANPPVWEAYRDAKNSLLVPGNYAYSTWHPKRDYEYYRGTDREILRAGRDRPRICLVTKVRRDRSMVRVSWPWGKTYGMRDIPGKPGWQRFMEYEVDKQRHCWIPMAEVFNVSAYISGEYKQFLCDAYQKGRYLEWAPPLLLAETWLKDNTKTK